MIIPWDGAFWDTTMLQEVEEAFERLEQGRIAQPVIAISNYEPHSEWYRHMGNVYIYWPENE